MENSIKYCSMVKQGFSKGAYEIILKYNSISPACQATLKLENGKYFWLIKAMHLS
jgi:hypothetical protein